MIPKLQRASTMTGRHPARRPEGPETVWPIYERTKSSRRRRSIAPVCRHARVPAQTSFPGSMARRIVLALQIERGERVLSRSRFKDDAPTPAGALEQFARAAGAVVTGRRAPTNGRLRLKAARRQTLMLVLQWDRDGRDSPPDEVLCAAAG